MFTMVLNVHNGLKCLWNFLQPPLKLWLWLLILLLLFLLKKNKLKKSKPKNFGSKNPFDQTNVDVGPKMC